MERIAGLLQKSIRSRTSAAPPIRQRHEAPPFSVRTHPNSSAVTSNSQNGHRPQKPAI
jgi:hypothetical protein